VEQTAHSDVRWAVLYGQALCLPASVGASFLGIIHHLENRLYGSMEWVQIVSDILKQHLNIGMA